MVFIEYSGTFKMFARLVCAAIALVSALSLGSGFTVGITPVATDSPPRWYSLVIVLWTASSAAADIIITTCMMTLLLHAKAGSYFGEVRDTITRLIRIVLQTGLLSSVMALLVLPFYFRNITGIYSLPQYILGKSYVISLLANFNARKRSNAIVVHGSENKHAPPTTKLSTVIFAPGANPNISDGGNSDSIGAVSLPVHSVVQINSQHGSIKSADINKESDQDSEAKPDPLNRNRSDLHSHNV